MMRLGSASCLSELRLRHGQSSYARELDVSDCFYQFRLEEAAAWFGLDDPRAYDEWRHLGFEVSDCMTIDWDSGHRERKRSGTPQ